MTLRILVALGMLIVGWFVLALGFYLTVSYWATKPDAVRKRIAKLEAEREDRQ